MTDADFDALWATLPIPGEYDAMDACDQGRWRDVVRQAAQERPYVPLTEAEIAAIHIEACKNNIGRYEYARAIEKAVLERVKR